jgi:hypothetical protein
MMNSHSEQKDEEKPELWHGRMACDLDFHCHPNYYPSGVKEKKHRDTKCEEGVSMNDEMTCVMLWHKTGENLTPPL